MSYMNGILVMAVRVILMKNVPAQLVVKVIILNEF